MISRIAKTSWNGSGLPDLDGPAVYAAFDPSGLGKRLGDLPRQCQHAWQQSQTYPLKELAGDYDQVVIGGMGGSAIAGDLVADLAALQRSLPITVVRGFHLPFALNRRSLFIACSYSGNTQETRSLFRQATDAGARALAVTSGGGLAAAAREHGVPVLPVAASGEPRSAIGYHLILLLGVLQQLELVNTAAEEAPAAIQSLERQLTGINEKVPTPDNPAKRLAGELLDKLVVVYGGGLFSGAARRWKTQLNENAKVWAFYESIPESLHNSVEAYGSASEAGQKVMALVLQPATATGELKERYQTLTELLRCSRVGHRTLPGTDGPPLAQLLSMILLGDYVSYYLALLQKLNPSLTPAIERGKALGESPVAS